MQKFKDDLGGLATFQCGFDTQCETTGSLLSSCAKAPSSAAGLTEIAHFNNFFREISQRLGNTLSILSDELPQLAQTFAPAEQAAIRPDDKVAELSFGLTVGGALLGMVPAPGALSVGAVISGATNRKLMATPGALPPPDNFQALADISKTLSDTRDGLFDGIKTFVNDRTNAIPESESYKDDEDELPQMSLDGSLAQAITDIPKAFDDGIRHVLTANAINKLWNDKQVIVVRFSTAAFQGEGGEGTNPCNPNGKDNIIGAELKYCDGQGNAYALQRTPLPSTMDLLSRQEILFSNLSIFDPPGFRELRNQNLDVETLTQRAVANQEKNGHFGLPKDDAFAKEISSISPDAVDVKDAMMSNFPVCDIDGPGLISSNQQSVTCPRRFDGQDTDKCIFMLKVLCGCPAQPLLNGKGWPYPTGGELGPCNIL